LKTETTNTKREWSRLTAEAQSLGVVFGEKSGWFWNCLGSALALIGCIGFNEHFITTIGRGVYFPVGWLERNAATAGGCEVLAHELVHVRQFKRFGFGSARIGIVPMFAVYCLFPLPVGLCLGRWWLERSAYLAGFRERNLIDRDPFDVAYLQWFVYDMMIGGSYGYAMWLAKGRVRRWVEKHINFSR